MGSPPRMRGKLWWGVRKAYKARITPAHAGKTNDMESPFPLLADHPRACGENALMIFLKSSVTGSPPRMRGKPSRAPPRLCVEDHPRACGENSRGYHRDALPAGSPPRMRGKRGLFCCLLKCNRITPAHAGKTYGILHFGCTA